MCMSSGCSGIPTPIASVAFSDNLPLPHSFGHMSEIVIRMVVGLRRAIIVVEAILATSGRGQAAGLGQRNGHVRRDMIAIISVDVVTSSRGRVLFTSVEHRSVGPAIKGVERRLPSQEGWSARRGGVAVIVPVPLLLHDYSTTRCGLASRLPCRVISRSIVVIPPVAHRHVVVVVEATAVETFLGMVSRATTLGVSSIVLIPAAPVGEVALPAVASHCGGRRAVCGAGAGAGEGE